MVGALPPSSSTVRLRPISRMICSATCPLPVKLTRATAGWVVSARPTSTSPWTMLKTPSGTPAETAISPSSAATPDPCGWGLRTKVFPAAKAGPNLWQSVPSGALKGVIPAITPSGSRTAKPSLPVPGARASIGITSPEMRLASSAEMAMVEMARLTSERESRTTLPVPRLMTSAISSALCDITSETLASIELRLCAGSRRHSCHAAAADSTASCTCATVFSCTIATTLPS